jgi:hypothetical protein
MGNGDLGSPIFAQAWGLEERVPETIHVLEVSGAYLVGPSTAGTTNSIHGAAGPTEETE